MIKKLGVVLVLMLQVTTGYAQGTPPDTINTALADLSTRAGQTLTLEDLTGWRWSQATYPDTSLNCPQAGQLYSQVVTPGYQFVLEYNGATFDYRASVDETILILCSGPAVLPPAGPTAVPTVGRLPTPTSPVTPGASPPPTLLEGAQIYRLPQGNQPPITAENATRLTRFIELPASEAITSLAWSGEVLAVTSFSGIRLYDMLALQQPPRLFRVPNGPTLDAAFSADSSLMVTGHADGMVRLWDMEAGSLRAVLPAHTGPVYAVAFSPEGAYFVSAGGRESSTAMSAVDNTIRLWETESQSVAAVLEGHTDAVSAVAFNTDGSVLASAGQDHTVRLWDVASGTPGTVLSSYTQPVRTLSFSPDGTWLASAGDDGRIQLWEVGAGTQSTLEGHPGGVRALAFSPDGAVLVTTGTTDGMLRLWDLATNTEVSALDLEDVGAESDGEFSSPMFGADGVLLVFATSSGDQGMVHLWGVEP